MLLISFVNIHKHQFSSPLVWMTKYQVKNFHQISFTYNQISGDCSPILKLLKMLDFSFIEKIKYYIYTSNFTKHTYIIELLFFMKNKIFNIYNFLFFINCHILSLHYLKITIF